MKQIIILAVVLFVAVTFNAEAKRNHHGVGGYFYTELSPYGSWIEVDYGVVVWRPTIIRVNWMPYQMGSWVWTCDGWYWDSYEPFGFITYHYGRWYYDQYYGWLWYPDYEWAPAWVEWRYDNDYIGWAPLHPYANFSISVGIYWSNVYYTPYYHWNYVTYNYFCDPYVYNYYVEPGYKYRIYNETKYRHDYGYRNGRVQNRGIDVNYISTRSGQKIKQRDVIRTSDSRELKRNSFENRDEIRTLDIKRDDMVRNDLSRMEIKKENRRTSLDLEKVQIGKRENINIVRTENNTTNRNFDTRKNDQNKRDIKTGIDKIFEKNRNDSNRNTEFKTDRTRETVEKRTNETINNEKRIDMNQKKNEIVTRNENKVFEQNRTQTNKTKELNRQDHQQKKDVNRKNTTINTQDQIKRNEVKVEKRNDDQQTRNIDTRVQKDSKTEKDNSREKSRR